MKKNTKLNIIGIIVILLGLLAIYILEGKGNGIALLLLIDIFKIDKLIIIILLLIIIILLLKNRKQKKD